MEFSHGMMVEDTRENTWMIKSTERVSLSGLMEGSMMEAGKMVDNTEEESTMVLMANKRKENGLMVREPDGLVKVNKKNNNRV